MRKAFALLLPVLAFTLSGCLAVSLQPLYRDQDTLLVPELVGRWRERQSSNDTWEITRLADRAAYRMVLTEANGERGVFEGRFIKLEQTLFLDLTPGDMDGSSRTSGVYSVHFLEGHSFVRVELGTSPTLRPVDYKWLKTLLEKTPGALRHELIGDPSDARIVLTASTLQLQAFLRAHAATDAAFGEPTVLEAMKEK